MLKKLFRSNYDFMEAFINSIIGISDILVVELERGNTKKIKDNLEKLLDLFLRLFSSEKEEQKSHKDILSVLSDCSLREQVIFSPEKYAPGFIVIPEQIIRVYNAALKNSNLDIALASIYKLKVILCKMVTLSDNSLYVETILRKIAKITCSIIDNDNRDLFIEAISFYNQSVFFSENFKLEYLEHLEYFLFELTKKIISDNRFILFKRILPSVCNAVFIIEPITRYLSDYVYHSQAEEYSKGNYVNLSKYDIEYKFNELDYIYNSITSQGNLISFQEKFNNLKKIVLDMALSDRRKRMSQIEKEILNEVNKKYKCDRLTQLFLKIGAFCLFQKRLDFIRYLWQYHQPDDADAKWVGYDVIPHNPNNLMEIYFFITKDNLSFSDHHGSEKYVDEYFILLLCKIFQANQRVISTRKYPISDFRLQRYDVYQLNNLSYQCDKLIEVANMLKLREQLLSELGFNDFRKLFDEYVVPFFEKIKQASILQLEAQHRDLPMNNEKIELFKREIMDKFKKIVVLRTIVSYLTSYEYIDKFEDIIPLRIDSIVDKALFFEKWYVHFDKWSDSYAQAIARGEDNSIFGSIFNQCSVFETKNVTSILAQFNNLENIFMLTSYSGIWEFFQKQDKFIPVWQDASGAHLTVSGYQGCFQYEGKLIPVFQINGIEHDEHILVLDKNNFGTLRQYSPLNADDSGNLLNGIFRINIQSLSERKDLIDKFIKEQPEWLQQIGDEMVQKKHVEQKAIIELSEKLEFIPDHNFIGYRIPVSFLIDNFQ